MLVGWLVGKELVFGQEVCERGGRTTTRVAADEREGREGRGS